MAGFQSLTFDFKALDVFEAVYAALSMTEAARQLEMTQSAVSQSVARLEANLGLTLFERGRPLQATPAADELAGRLPNLLSELQKLETSVRERGAAGRPMVRIGMVDSFAATVGPKLIRRLRNHAERLSVWSGISRNLEGELLSGKLDVLVGSKPMSGVKGIVSTPLLSEPYFIVLPTRMAKTMGEVKLRDLAQNHPFVRYSMRSKIGADIETYLEQAGTVPPQSLEFDGTEAAFAMITGGIGWAITTPLCLIHGHTRESGLTASPLPTPVPLRTLYLLTSENLDEALASELRSEAKNVLTDLITSGLQELAPWAMERVRVG